MDAAQQTGTYEAGSEDHMRVLDRDPVFFRSRPTNAICEGINSMIQAAKLSLAFPNPLR